MAQVPYSPVPEASPSNQGTPRLSLDTPVAAFGGAVAQALEGLGGKVAHVGDELFTRALAMQELKNHTEAAEADAQYQIEVGKLHADFSSKKGLDAGPEALDKYTQDLSELRNKIRAGLSNDHTRRYYDSNSLSTMGRTIFNGAGHSGAELKRAAHEAAGAKIKLSQDSVELNPHDEVLYRRTQNDVAHDTRLQVELDSGAKVDPDVLKWRIKKAQSETLFKRLNGLAKNEPYKAKEWFEKYKGQLTGDDRDKAFNQIEARINTVGAIQIEQQVNAEMRQPHSEDWKDKTLPEKIEEAAKIAEKLDPGNKMLVRNAQAQVLHQHNQFRQVKKDAVIESQQDVDEVINTGKYKTIEELKNDPKAQAGLDWLERNAPSIYQRIPAKINGYLAARNKVTNQETLNTFVGMAESDDPAVIERFLDINPYDEQLSQEGINKISRLQREKRKDMEADPQLRRALQILKPTLDSIPIDLKTDFRFRGSLQATLQAYRDTHAGKKPTDKEIQEMGTRLSQEQPDPNKWNFGVFNRTSPLYEHDLSEVSREAIRKSITDAGAPPPTDEQIRQEMIRRQLLKHYKSQKRE